MPVHVYANWGKYQNFVDVPIFSTSSEYIQSLALPVLGRLLVLLRPQRGRPSVQAFLIPAAIKFKLDQKHHDIVLYPLLLT